MSKTKTVTEIVEDPCLEEGAGWGGLDAVTPRFSPVREEDAERARMLTRAYRECFTSPAGKTVLAHLRSRTLDQPCWVAGLESTHGFTREGQNSVIREIERRIKED